MEEDNDDEHGPDDGLFDLVIYNKQFVKDVEHEDDGDGKNLYNSKNVVMTTITTTTSTSTTSSPSKSSKTPSPTSITGVFDLAQIGEDIANGYDYYRPPPPSSTHATQGDGEDDECWYSPLTFFKEKKTKKMTTRRTTKNTTKPSLFRPRPKSRPDHLIVIGIRESFYNEEESDSLNDDGNEEYIFVKINKYKPMKRLFDILVDIKAKCTYPQGGSGPTSTREVIFEYDNWIIDECNDTPAELGIGDSDIITMKYLDRHGFNMTTTTTTTTALSTSPPSAVPQFFYYPPSSTTEEYGLGGGDCENTTGYF